MKIEKLHHWGRTHDLKKLHKSLDVHDFNIRVEAISQLRKIGEKSSVEHLEKLIDDSFLIVIDSALAAIKEISPGHSSIPDFELRVKELKNYESKRNVRTSKSFEPISKEEEREKLKRMAKDYDILKIHQQGLKEERRQIFSWRIAITILGLIALILSFLRYFVFF